MIADLDTYIQIVKVVWPIAMWIGWVNHTVKRTEKDLDYLYFVLRGRKGMRVRSFPARLKRVKFEIRKRLNGTAPGKSP